MQAIAKKIANGQLDCRVHRGRGRAQPVRDRQARLARWARACSAAPPASAGCTPWRRSRSRPPLRRADGCHGRQPRARRPRRLRRRAQRRAGRARPGLAADLGGHRARRRWTPRCIAYRVAEDRRVFLPCAISADGAFLTHSQALVQGPDPGEGRQVPAALRPGRSAAPPRQPDHDGARRPTRTGSSRSAGRTTRR